MSNMESYKVNIQIPIDPIKYPGKFFKLKDIKEKPEISDKIKDYFNTFYTNVKLNIDDPNANLLSTIVEVSFDHDNSKIYTIRDGRCVLYMVETEDSYLIFDKYDDVIISEMTLRDFSDKGVYFFKCCRFNKTTTGPVYEPIIRNIKLSFDTTEYTYYKNVSPLTAYKRTPLVKPLMSKLYSKIDLNNLNSTYVINNLDFLPMRYCKYWLDHFKTSKYWSEVKKEDTIDNINKNLLGPKNITDEFLSKFTLTPGSVEPSPFGDNLSYWTYKLDYSEPDIYVLIKAPKFECLLRTNIENTRKGYNYIPDGHHSDIYYPVKEKCVFENFHNFYNDKSCIIDAINDVIRYQARLTDLQGFKRGEILAINLASGPDNIKNYVNSHPELKNKIIFNVELNEPDAEHINMSLSFLELDTDPISYIEKYKNLRNDVNVVNLRNKIYELYANPTPEFITALYEEGGMRNDFGDSLYGTYILPGMESASIEPYFYPQVKCIYLDKNFKNY